MVARDDAAVARVADCLNAGGVALVPTDTVYGLAVSPTHRAAVERLFALKRRPPSINLPIMVASPAGLETLGLEISAAARSLLDSPLIPGAVTIALGFRKQPDQEWLEGRKEVAIRIPDCEWLLKVLQMTGPLLVTSANAHGLETPHTLEQALAQLDGSPDVAIDGGVLESIASTLVNCRQSPPVIEREGVVSRTELMRYLR